jgi:hypothetical protein
MSKIKTWERLQLDQIFTFIKQNGAIKLYGRAKKLKQMERYFDILKALQEEKKHLKDLNEKSSYQYSTEKQLSRRKIKELNDQLKMREEGFNYTLSQEEIDDLSRAVSAKKYALEQLNPAEKEKVLLIYGRPKPAKINGIIGNLFQKIMGRFIKEKKDSQLEQEEYKKMSKLEDEHLMDTAWTPPGTIPKPRITKPGDSKATDEEIEAKEKKPDTQSVSMEEVAKQLGELADEIDKTTHHLTNKQDDLDKKYTPEDVARELESLGDKIAYTHNLNENVGEKDITRVTLEELLNKQTPTNEEAMENVADALKNLNQENDKNQVNDEVVRDRTTLDYIKEHAEPAELPKSKAAEQKEEQLTPEIVGESLTPKGVSKALKEELSIEKTPVLRPEFKRDVEEVGLGEMIEAVEKRQDLNIDEKIEAMATIMRERDAKENELRKEAQKLKFEKVGNNFEQGSFNLWEESEIKTNEEEKTTNSSLDYIKNNVVPAVEISKNNDLPVAPLEIPNTISLENEGPVK